MMKKNFRILVSLVATVFGVMSFSSCGSDEPDPGTVASNDLSDATIVREFSEQNERIYQKPDGTQYYYYGAEGCFGLHRISSKSVASYAVPSMLKLNGRDIELKKIDDEVFGECTELTKVTLPKTVLSIGNRAFYRCAKLKNVNTESVRFIGESAFSGCEQLASVSLKTAEDIGKEAFSNTAITTLSLSATLKSIGVSSFAGCDKLVVVELPESLEKLEKSAFQDCVSLQRATIASSVSLKEVGEYAFGGCVNLSIVSVGEGVVEIRDNAFSSCENLTKVVLPSTIEKIGDGVFADSNKLIEFHVGAVNPPAIKETSFPVLSKKEVEERNLYVPATSVDSYSSWKAYFDQVVKEIEM